ILLMLRDHEAECPDAFFRVATAAIGDALNAERVSVWMLEEDGEAIVCHDLHTLSTQEHVEGGRLTRADYPAYFAAIREHTSILAHDAHTHPATQEFSAKY